MVDRDPDPVIRNDPGIGASPPNQLNLGILTESPANSSTQMLFRSRSNVSIFTNYDVIMTHLWYFG